MIQDHDRTGYIGASDTKYVMGRWNTKTFKAWWDIKTGMEENTVDNIYTRAGNAYEGRILDYLGIEERDRQIIIGRLRINLDGETASHVVEIKTYKYSKGWKMPKYYWQQVQVEMFAKDCQFGVLYAYGLLDEEYEEYGEIDPNRLTAEIIFREDEFIEKYLTRALYLCSCLEKGEEPDESKVS